MIPRALFQRASRYRLAAPSTKRPGRGSARPVCRAAVTAQSIRTPMAVRFYASERTADEQIEEIQDLYATAKDEFEMAFEETEKVTIYAQSDREAAREELDKLEAAYKDAVDKSDPEVGQEIQRRVGQRVRELANAVKNMEEMAQNQD